MKRALQQLALAVLPVTLLLVALEVVVRTTGTAARG